MLLIAMSGTSAISGTMSARSRGVPSDPPAFALYVPCAFTVRPAIISAKMRSVSLSVSTVSNSGSLSSWLSLL